MHDNTVKSADQKTKCIEKRELFSRENLNRNRYSKEEKKDNFSKLDM